MSGEDSESSNFLRAEAELVLTEARREKAERTKDLGSPIQLAGKALAIQIKDNYAWIAENTTVARKIDLESGKTVQIFKGHTAPVTCLAFYEILEGTGYKRVLITGSWDKTIKLWDTTTKSVISSTDAHSDFVKSLFVIPSLKLLISGSSDKIVRFWDLSTIEEGKPLVAVGSISSHTRPVECIDATPQSETSAILYTADTMGIIKIWDLKKDNGTPPRWQSKLRNELDHHRTRINEMFFGNGQLWTASSDDTVQIVDQPPSDSKKPPPPIAHPVAVRSLLPLSLTDLAEPVVITGAGDMIRVYDLSTPEEPELISEIDAHWHDVTSIRLWVRKTVGDDGKTRVEPWVVSASLDGTIRKWRLHDLLHPPPAKATDQPTKPIPSSKPANESKRQFEMSEEEERELAELMDDD